MVNGDLHHVITATRHLAAALFAPGDARIEDGSGRGESRFPPESMRLAFVNLLRNLTQCVRARLHACLACAIACVRHQAH